MNPDVMVAPEIDYLALLPMIIVGVAAVLGVIVETFVGRRARRPVQLVLVFGSLAGAFAALVWQSGTRSLEVEGALAIDGPGILLMGLVLVVAFVGAMLMAERQLDPAGDSFAPRASALPGSVEQQHPDPLLEHLDAARQRRLRQEDLFGRPAEGAGFGQGHEVAQLHEGHRVLLRRTRIRRGATNDEKNA